MTRPAPWKVLAFAAALTGLGMAGAATATAQPSKDGSDASTSRSVDVVREGSDTSTSQSNDDSRIGLVFIPR